MSIDTPIRDTASTASKSVDRRTLLKAGAWAAPVVLLTTAAPAMAASIEPVPTAQLTVTSGALTNSGTGGALGPLSWAGGTIAWSRSTPGQPTTASVSYTVAISGPGVSTTLVTSATNIANGSSFPVPGLTWGTAPLAGGTYTITLTAFGSDGSKSATSSVTLVAPPVQVTSAATVVGVSGNKHDVTLTLTGAAGTIVNISTTLTSTTLNNPFPTTGTIGAGGTFSVTRTANATGQTAGTIVFGLSGTNVVVTPASITKTIPVKSSVGVVTP